MVQPLRQSKAPKARPLVVNSSRPVSKPRRLLVRPAQVLADTERTTSLHVAAIPGARTTDLQKGRGHRSTRLCSLGQVHPSVEWASVVLPAKVRLVPVSSTTAIQSKHARRALSARAPQQGHRVYPTPVNSGNWAGLPVPDSSGCWQRRTSLHSSV